MNPTHLTTLVLTSSLLIGACALLPGCNRTPADQPVPKKESPVPTATMPNPAGGGRKQQPMPEMVGATNDPITVASSNVELGIDVHPPSGPVLLRANPAETRVFLALENITGDAEANEFDVYLNLPAGADPAKFPELLAGRVALFGLEAAGPSTGRSGMFQQLDITALHKRLSLADGWDPKRIRVTIVPAHPGGKGKLLIGRISLYLS